MLSATCSFGILRDSAHAVAEIEVTDFLHLKSSSAFAKVKRINKIVLSPKEIGLSSAPWFSLTRIMASCPVFTDRIGRECCATGDRRKRSCGRHRPVVGHQRLCTFLERSTFAGRRGGRPVRPSPSFDRGRSAVRHSLSGLRECVGLSRWLCPSHV
jgi:hypothetical protein